MSGRGLSGLGGWKFRVLPEADLPHHWCRLPMPLLSDEFPNQREILEQEQSRFFGRIVGARVAVLPVLAGALIGLAALEPVGWRVGLLYALAVIAPTFFVVELLRYRRRGFYAGAVPLNLGVAALGQLAVCAATGGLLSPFIYGVVFIAAVLGASLARRQYLVLTCVQLLAIWAFAFAATLRELPSFGVGQLLGGGSGQPLIIPAAYYYAHASLLSVIAVAAGQAGRAVTAMFQTAFRRTHRAQQELLDEHAERIRELTALSAEIAHELKNPLASVKGLSALMAQNTQEPKASERFAVLRREVDRMQSILEEFLNFSRPLVPLALVPTEPAPICLEVAALHEGLAQARRVELRCEGRSSSVECDPRKVKQILINLVQNALDASPSGSTVTIRVDPSGAGARVQVIDQGRGLDQALGNVFEPGVTSKSGGAGIGLTIARSLARQHGGELKLETAKEGGCVAELFLPAQPPDATAPARDGGGRCT